MAVEDIFTFSFKYFCQTVMLLVQLTFECQFRPIIFLLKGKISKYPYFVNYYYTYFLEQVLDCTNKDLFHVLYIHSFIHSVIYCCVYPPSKREVFQKSRYPAVSYAHRIHRFLHYAKAGRICPLQNQYIIWLFWTNIEYSQGLSIVYERWLCESEHKHFPVVENTMILYLYLFVVSQAQKFLNLGLPQCGKSQGKWDFIEVQGKVREFYEGREFLNPCLKSMKSQGILSSGVSKLFYWDVYV